MSFLKAIKCLPKAQEDYSESNPGLHKLYVRFAYESLSVVNEAIEQLMEHSRITSADAASRLVEWREEMCLGSQAYREAQLMLVLNIPLDYNEDEADAS